MTETAVASARPVLVLFAPADEPFVRGYLLPALGELTGVEARGAPVDVRDLAATALDELERALQQPGVTIAVISAAFLDNQWLRHAELLATGASLDGPHDVVPLVLGDCTLPLHIRARRALKFQDRAHWEDEMTRLREFLARPAPVERKLPCPYPGMRPFQASDASSFRGRDSELDALLAMFDAGEREIYLVGPSGCGKSSLIAAGLVPRLEGRAGGGALVVRTMRPGDAPVRRLAECLEIADGSAPGAEAVAAWAAHHAGARLLVVVDQLEELFAQAPRAEQTAFTAALGALRGEPRCLIVLALRADFYGELLQSALWLEGHRKHIDIAPLRGVALRQAIELPARSLDVHFEQGLIDRLLGDAAEEPGALPMLQETLVQLWSRLRRRLLMRADYDALGDGKRSGLAVAIAARADRCVAELAPAQVAIARRVLLRLVSFGEGRPNTRRRQSRAQLAGGEPATVLDEVLRHLAAARLITVDGGERPDDALVDLCHEVLITAWPAFASWVESRRSDEQRRRQLQGAADEWLARGRGASGLLDDGELAAAMAWRRGDAAAELGETPAVTVLIEASHSALERARRRWLNRLIAVCAGLTTLAAAAVVMAVIARQQAAIAVTARERAVHALGEQLRDAGREAVAGGHFQRALPYLVAAGDLGIDDIGLRSLFHTATPTVISLVLRHAGAVRAASFSSDGSRIVTASEDHTAQVWDALSGAPIGPPLVHPHLVHVAAFSRDGKRVLTTSDDNAAWLWDLTASPPRAVALRHAAQVNTAVFSADDRFIVTASSDHTVRLWNARTGDPIGAPLLHDAPVARAAVSADGTRVVTIVSEGLSAAIWDTATGARIAPLREHFTLEPQLAAPRAHRELVLCAAFSPDGRRLATIDAQGEILLWDARTGSVVQGPLVHRGDPWAWAAFSPDNARLATTAANQVWIWDLTTGAVVGSLEHTGPITPVSYSSDGERIIASCADKTIWIWDVASRTQLAKIELEAGMTDDAFSPDVRRVLTASNDGRARVWDVHATVPRVLDRSTQAVRVFNAAYSPDGAHIAIAYTSSHVKRWTSKGALEDDLATMGGTFVPVFSRDGARLLVSQIDGAARITAPITQQSPLTLQPWPRVPGQRRDSGAPDSFEYHTVARAAISADGRRFVTTTGDHAAQIWDSATNRATAPPLLHQGSVAMSRFDPDGGRVITASSDGTARLWDAATGAPIGVPLVHPTRVTVALFSPDGALVATVASDHLVRLWDARLPTHQKLADLRGHAGDVLGAAFSPDGHLLMTYSTDHSVRLWSVVGHDLVVPPLEHASSVTSAAFSPDGARLVTTAETSAQIWDIATGRPLAPPLVHPDLVRLASFSPDGSSVLTVSRDAVRIWDAAIETRPVATWRRAVIESGFPQLEEALARIEPAPDR